MLRLSDILERVAEYHPKANLDLIKKAYVFSAQAHRGQQRKSGEPYLVHPLEVTHLLCQLKLDEFALSAGILHDTVEDTDTTIDEIEKLFGKEVAELVDGVTKLSKLEFTNTHEKQAENFRKMLVAMAKDLRVILVKLADRLHNMRTLEYMKPAKQELISRETIEIYAPLANRLGIGWIKTELEDLAFKYLFPKEFNDLVAKVNKKEKERNQYIEKVIDIIKKDMAAHNIQGEVTGRQKSYYSIFKKMKKNLVDYEDIHDILAFRILTNTMPECYASLGIIHSLWKPISGRFKDYIAMPKPNDYQSLHSTVIGPGGERIEIQIRTITMHTIAEEGIAAHWVYKEGRAQLGLEKTDKKFAWLRQLMELQKELKDPTEFIEQVKVDLFTDEVYVFTPKGDVKELPRGSTALDFSFEIHTDLGLHCVGAKVNDRIVPLKYRLKNGDVIEILTNKTQKPSKDWLSFVRTSKAQTKIRNFIRIEQRQRGLELGEQMLEKEFRKFGLSFSKVVKKGDLDKFLQESKYKEVGDVILAVGYGKVLPQQILQKVLPKEEFEAASENVKKESESKLSQILKKVTLKKQKSSGVIIDGIDDIMVHYGKCCNPLPGDHILGFVTRGKGITVHHQECSKILETDPDRRVKVEWDPEKTFTRNVSLRIYTEDKPGILANISNVFTKSNINIGQANCKALDNNRAVNTFEISIKSLSELRGIIKSLEGISGVQSVERLTA